ncbi:MAG: hypothetical protein ACYDB7_03385 [Mycobacteriales bacterium]
MWVLVGIAAQPPRDLGQLRLGQLDGVQLRRPRDVKLVPAATLALLPQPDLAFQVHFRLCAGGGVPDYGNPGVCWDFQPEVAKLVRWEASMGSSRNRYI